MRRLVSRLIKRAEWRAVSAYRSRRLNQTDRPIDLQETVEIHLIRLDICEDAEERLRLIEELVKLGELRAIGPAVRELSNQSRAWPEGNYKEYVPPLLKAVTSFARTVTGA